MVPRAGRAALYVAVVAVTATLLSGCGGSDDPQAGEGPAPAGSDSTTATTTEPTTTTAPPSPARLYAHDVVGGNLFAIDAETLETVSTLSVLIAGDEPNGEYRMDVFGDKVAIVHPDIGVVQVVDPVGGTTDELRLREVIDVTAVGEALWAASPAGITIYDATLEVAATVPLPFKPNRFSHVGDTIWVMSKQTSDIAVLDPETRQVTDTISGTELAAVAPLSDEGDYFGSEFDDRDGVVAVVAFADDVVIRIDAEDRAVVGASPTGDGPSGVITDDAAMWLAIFKAGYVARYDPVTGIEGLRIEVAEPEDVVADDRGGVYVLSVDGPLRHYGPDGTELASTTLTGKATSLILG